VESLKVMEKHEYKIGGFYSYFPPPSKKKNQHQSTSNPCRITENDVWGIYKFYAVQAEI
jgi:hypothetical protein